MIFFLLSKGVFDPFQMACLNSSKNLDCLCFDSWSYSTKILRGCYPFSFFLTYSILFEYILRYGGSWEIVIDTCYELTKIEGFSLLHFQIHSIKGSSMKTSQKSIITCLLSCKAVNDFIIACLKIPSYPIGSIISVKHFVNLKGINSGTANYRLAPKLYPKSIKITEAEGPWIKKFYKWRSPMPKTYPTTQATA